MPGRGFRELYGWLNERDVLIVKADRQEPLVVTRVARGGDRQRTGKFARRRDRR